MDTWLHEATIKEPRPSIKNSEFGVRFHHLHQLLYLRPLSELKVIVHPQEVLGGYLGDCQVPSSKPALREETHVLHVHFSNVLRFKAVISDDDFYVAIETPDATQQHLESRIAQERLGDDGDSSDAGVHTGFFPKHQG
ncbi:hypothetical protein EYF80_047765 [Liparis tanakae]|uniref:Uncharacterized protein n=1 Tax=Liparis tanakae TaxID=230148 RepID=A0A4Z2FMP9_9TELE|nr:hypothetical protein EYF80_047765 [Liparis tanakae]